MLEMIKKHLADFSAGNWDDYKAQLTSDAVYEEVSTRQRVKGADEYVRLVSRWKKAFPDLKANVLDGFSSGDRVVAEIEWSGTHTGAFEGPFGTIQPTNKRGTVRASLVVTVKGGKIAESRHYFDLLTILSQLGIAPMAGAGVKAGAAAAPATH